jgi:Fatty acid/phospholipid biosynthesis enzyme
VVVTDGFTGNVALKTIEGAGGFATELTRAALQGSQAARFGTLFQRRALRELAGRMDSETYGGAALLGLEGTSSSPTGTPRPRGSPRPAGSPRIWRAAASPSGSANGSDPATGPATSCAASRAATSSRRRPGPGRREAVLSRIFVTGTRGETDMIMTKAVNSGGGAGHLTRQRRPPARPASRTRRLVPAVAWVRG